LKRHYSLLLRMHTTRRTSRTICPQGSFLSRGCTDSVSSSSAKSPCTNNPSVHELVVKIGCGKPSP
jgi:hypothetical protein